MSINWETILEWRAQGLQREIDVAGDASEIIDADEPGETLSTLSAYAQYVIDKYGHHEDFLATKCDCLGYTEGPFRDFLPAAYEDGMGEELTIEELEDEGGVVFAVICGYMIGLNDDTTKKFTYLFLRTLGGPSWSGLEDLDFSVPDDLLENYERIISNLFCETFLKLANR